MEKQIELKSFAKINLSLDVGQVMPNGMHPVDTVMQLVDLADMVRIGVAFSDELSGMLTCSLGENAVLDQGPTITISTNQCDLPTDKTNLAYKAAALLLEAYSQQLTVQPESIHINLEKNIPMAAGLAGGSGNAAAVFLGLNELLCLHLSLDELLSLGAKLGSDVPFCIAGIAKGNGDVLPAEISNSPLSTYCVRARGTGTDMEIVKPLSGAVVIAKPAISLSTKDVYKGFDRCVVEKRPNNDRLVAALEEGDRHIVIEEMVNLLELHSLKESKVAELKQLMSDRLGAEKVLMSGSGPTVYALFSSFDEANEALGVLRSLLDDDYFRCAAMLLA